MSQDPITLARHGAHLVAAFLAAFAVTHVLAGIFYAQMVIAGLESVGVPVSLGVRLDLTIDTIFGLLDSALGGLLNSYGRAIFIGLAVAYAVAYLVKQLITPIPLLATLKPIAYPAAGATAIAAVLYFVYQGQGPGALAGARDVVGVVTQLLAGALGGAAFAALRPKPDPAQDAAGAVFGLTPPWSPVARA